MNFKFKNIVYTNKYYLNHKNKVENDLKKCNEISNNCFIGCINLKELNIPNSIIKISESCFMSCENLQEIIFLIQL